MSANNARGEIIKISWQSHKTVLVIILQPHPLRKNHWLRNFLKIWKKFDQKQFYCS